MVHPIQHHPGQPPRRAQLGPRRHHGRTARGPLSNGVGPHDLPGHHRVGVQLIDSVDKIIEPLVLMKVVLIVRHRIDDPNLNVSPTFLVHLETFRSSTFQCARTYRPCVTRTGARSTPPQNADRAPQCTPDVRALLPRKHRCGPDMRSPHWAMDSDLCRPPVGPRCSIRVEV